MDRRRTSIYLEAVSGVLCLPTCWRGERDWRKQKRDPLINHFPPLYFYGFLDKISYRTDTVSNSITTSHFHFFRVLDLPPIGTNSKTCPPKVAHVSKPAFQPSLLTRRRTLSSYTPETSRSREGKEAGCWFRRVFVIVAAPAFRTGRLEERNGATGETILMRAASRQRAFTLERAAPPASIIMQPKSRPLFQLMNGRRSSKVNRVDPPRVVTRRCLIND